MKRRIANILMVTIILVIAVAGVLIVGHIQGWFDKDDGNAAVLTQIRGIITMERDGVAYTAENETVLRQGDLLTCGFGATAVIQIGDSYLTLGENAKLLIAAPSAQAFAATAAMGEVFVFAADALSLSFEEKEVTFHNTVAALSVRSGAQSISVFEGAVEEAAAGEIIGWVGETVSVSALKINSLNTFTMDQIRAANERKVLCFSNADLDRLIADREAEMQAQLNQGRATDQTETAPTEAAQATQPSEETEPVQNTEPVTSDPKETTPSQTQPGQTAPSVPEPSQEEAPSAEPSQEEPSATGQPETGEPSQPKNTCTITIRCDTILSNMDDLDPAKAGYVPAGGVILSAKTVEFTEGETVFDVLQRVCSTYGIQLEYSWTPMYNSYYIEGINNLYEFDCGSESGWMYKVDGWFPNYGCSSYTLKNGENIVWCYTCNGLGADVGA